MTKESSVSSANNDSSGEGHTLGVLFVHGIGEQPRGDTLLKFGDPCIQWLERWLRRQRETDPPPEKKLKVTRVRLADGVPVSASVACPGNPETILFEESWWARTVSPPPIYELSWWLLLVGTWTTLSHGSKQIVQKAKAKQSVLLPLSRLVFFYIPVAFSYQVIIFLFALLGAIPFTPWQNFFSRALLRMSRTLGDSYVLLNSPIQRRAAIDRLVSDLNSISKKCDRVMVIAHSQGAAIAYYALRSADFKPDSEVYFYTVGSGLDKLEEIKALSQGLEFRGKAESIGFRRYLFLTPILFLLFWASVITVLFLGPSSNYGVAVMIIVAAVFVLLAVGYRIKKPGLTFYHGHWYDIYATSDPVANGPIDVSSGSNSQSDLAEAGAEGKTESPITKSKEIVNHRSLLRDHTSYFTNSIDFIPYLVIHMKCHGKINWLEGLPTWDEWSKCTEVRSRKTRKGAVQLSKWLNFFGFLLYATHRHGGLEPLLQNVWDMLNLLTRTLFGFGDEPSSGAAGCPYWLFGLLVFVGIDVFIRWCDRTSDKAATNLIFCEDGMLNGVRTVLTWLTLLAPLGVWVGMSVT